MGRNQSKVLTTNQNIDTQSKVCSSSGNYLWPDRNIFLLNKEVLVVERIIAGYFGFR